eukprot:TRINITY_DN16437_c0_g1_i1.p1 TRINITY_DN16437_c0_g1~~TRINITY_DN16437_c0_g1_i1.p1  ORF type:complete len:309 (+),score=38.76 TRINITY_DN16437_c0_g1_i1:112-1038(+)
MCIRDRYQRRVRETSTAGVMIGSSSMRVLVAVLASVLANLCEASPAWLVIGVNTVPRHKPPHPPIRYLERTINAIEAQLAGTAFEGAVHVHIVNHVAGKHAVFEDLKHQLAGKPYYHFSEVVDRLPDPHINQPWNPWNGDVNVPSGLVRRQSLDLVSAFQLWSAKVLALGASYFLTVEDDMELCPSGMQAIRYAVSKASARLNWSVLRVSYGMNGLVFKAADVSVYGEYLHTRFSKRPPDHIVVEWFASETIPATQHFKGRKNAAFRYQLWEHLGSVSAVGNVLDPTCPLTARRGPEPPRSAMNSWRT